ncbi:MAG: DEAD/DEAH box helicase [Spirochaetaceae bacterium]|jgi:DEAD/DEAH box helicase domain-containing protein|nr:DEAD/DEAH box helicase [Spirochaetaceae bacterium]
MDGRVFAEHEGLMDGSSPQEALERILASPEFASNIVVNRRIPAAGGTYAPFPRDADPRISAALESRGISRLYTHQAQVWEHSRKGRNVIVVTPTASGKTLCYNLPVLQALLEDEEGRALYLFPTKALSQDQQAELGTVVSGGPSPPGVLGLPVKVVTYDGDTPGSLRIAARDTGRIVISNPDMLHGGILPNHPKWIRFFSRLKFIVIDEIHTYRGVLGSHVANVIRRLRRIAAFYGAHPRFILCSATIANPRELGSALIGNGDLVLVDTNGAPRGEKRVILYNPPLVDSAQGIRKSAMAESRRWMTALLRAGIKTILFAHSRVKTEVTAAYINEDLQNFYTGNRGIRVEPYRGGLLPHERREIERGLREGTIRGVVSTNALELGIDIGGLDASVVAGFPGSFNSFWQQSGRAGRRGGTSVSVFVASSSPIDQFIMNNPEWFFERGAEEARIDPDNPYILTDHVKCACFELPFRDWDIAENREPFGEVTAALEYLQEDGIVRHTPGGGGPAGAPDSRTPAVPENSGVPGPQNGGRWHWSDRSFPAEGISLRSATADNVVIVDLTQGRNAVIGEMDRPSAKELIFKNAVYIHRGRQYLVEELDIPKRKCLVREAEINYFTDGLVKTDIKVLSEDEFIDGGERSAENHGPGFIPAPVRSGSPSYYGVVGDVLVRSQVSKFKKIRFHTHENIGYGDIDLGEEEMQTRAVMLLFPRENAGGKFLATLDEAGAGSVLSGAGTLIKSIAPVYLLCDPRDLGIAERVRDPHFGLPALYIYDKYPGGTGLAEALGLKIPEVFAAAATAVTRCPCSSGCPSCVGPGGNKQGTVEFLSVLGAFR